MEELFEVNCACVDCEELISNPFGHARGFESRLCYKLPFLQKDYAMALKIGFNAVVC